MTYDNFAYEADDSAGKNPDIESHKRTKDGDANESHDVSENFLKRFLQSPCDKAPKGINCVTILSSALLAWALLYVLLRHEVAPGGQLFALLFLAVASHLCGWLISFLHLPPLLGMLLCGIASQNLGLFHMTGVYNDIVINIRAIALTIMLLKAGVGLDASALKKLSFVVIRLSFLPCIVETIAEAVAAKVIMRMPWLWGILLGLVLNAVSPAVVIPCLLSLKERGYGENKGISTLVIAASSFDDIISIAGFGVILGILFVQGDPVNNIIHGPIEIIIGLLLGISWGFVAACIPHRNEDHLVVKRTLMVGGGALVAVLGSEMMGYAGSGPLAAMIIPFLASMCWKWQGGPETYKPVEKNFTRAWVVVEPLLFGLIGAEINFNDINVQIITEGLGILIFGILLRIIACTGSLLGSKLNWKEIIFVNITWMPKATVQAALAPVALDLAKKLNRDDVMFWAESILTISVLTILITAPLGAIGITLGGPKLLSTAQPMKKSKKIQNDVAAIEEQ